MADTPSVVTRSGRLDPATAAIRVAVRATLATECHAGDLVLVGVSGGADSMALASAARFEGGKCGVRVGAVIVEHGLQPETADVARRTAETLERWGLAPVLVLPVTVEHDKAAGTEAAARDARYTAIDAAAAEAGAVVVLLGHTLDDQAETVLLGLARGSGTRSLSGMRAVSAAYTPAAAARGIRYARPLLGIRRSATRASCAARGIPVWHDPQNLDGRFRRVAVRQRVLPVLETELGPGIAEALARTAGIVQRDADAIEAIAASKLPGAVLSQAASSIELSVDALQAEPGAVRTRMFILAARSVGAGPLSASHLAEIDRLLDAWHGQRSLDVPGASVSRSGGGITIAQAFAGDEPEQTGTEES